MNTFKHLNAAFLGTAAAIAFASAAAAGNFNIPGGDLASALNAYTEQSGVALIVSGEAVRGVRTKGVNGALNSDEALSRLLDGTGFVMQHRASGAVTITRDQRSEISDFQIAQAAPARAAVETVTVTSSKLGGADVQSIPISITALSQEQLTASQTNGGPDLIKQVPNMTFTKTNFSGYSIQLRGIGTQAISVTTDPAVAVAFNDTPFIRNHFFEQEFFDVSQVQVLRGPQGTLYGRNATAGVVNISTAKPTDQFEAMASAEFGNFRQRRFEAMVNLPIVDDWLDLRLAGQWTMRDGYSYNETTGERTDGRDLWSGRATLGFKPVNSIQSYFIWEHFSEDDDRLRSSKQLCKTDPIPSEVGGENVLVAGGVFNMGGYLSQGCQRASLYSPDAFQVPNGFSLPYYLGPQFMSMMTNVNPYASTVQSTNLRVMQSQIEPKYKVKNDVVEWNTDFELTPMLTFTSQTGFNNDFLWATQDYNRFNTAPGVFKPNVADIIDANGVFCDPQLGCSDKLLAQDLVTAKSWQASQEFRLASHFGGPFNFSVGGSYLHYETHEDYYVFINSLTAYAWGEGGNGGSGQILRAPWQPGVSDNHECLGRYGGYREHDPSQGGGYTNVNACVSVDPNPIESLTGEGHNYFLSKNPYVLNSYAAFGEAYYNVTSDIKLTGGLRWTQDRKHFTLIPSELLADGWGYGSLGVVDQQWDAITGRANINWTPELSFTDQTLLFGSFAHGYKAGGANPPGAVLLLYGGLGNNPNPTHPLTFKPEYIDAFELGTKNTLLDGALTLNAGAFYYNYENYQISEIVDRTAINRNFDAHVKGGEIEATWEPVPGLRFNMSGGYEDARLAKGQKVIDLMDRTAGDPNYMVMKPFATQASNCIFPVSEIPWLIKLGNQYGNGQGSPAPLACGVAYVDGNDPLTGKPYQIPVPATDAFFNSPVVPGYPGFDPSTVPNNGQGIEKNVGGNMLPNAPPWTLSAGAQYSMPISSDWAATFRGDFYWQSNSWWRVFEDHEYNRLHGYSNVNLTLILTNQSGWQAMAFMKNVFNTTAITGAFLNSDDSGLTTNVFLTDPKLIGLRLTKNW
jgi:outer membrane receptor protein involved in Fe transport